MYSMTYLQIGHILLRHGYPISIRVCVPRTKTIGISYLGAEAVLKKSDLTKRYRKVFIY